MEKKETLVYLACPAHPDFLERLEQKENLACLVSPDKREIVDTLDNLVCPAYPDQKEILAYLACLDLKEDLEMMDNPDYKVHPGRAH